MLQTWHTITCTAMSTCSSPKSSTIVYGAEWKREGRHQAQPPPVAIRATNQKASQVGRAMPFLLRTWATFTLKREKKGGGGRRVGADLMTKNRKRQDNI